MQCGDDSSRSVGLNILSVFMAVLLLKEACVLRSCLLFCGTVRVASGSKRVICLAVTFRHSGVTRVDLTGSEEMQGYAK